MQNQTGKTRTRGAKIMNNKKASKMVDIIITLNINDKIHHFKTELTKQQKKAKPNCMYL